MSVNNKLDWYLVLSVSSQSVPLVAAEYPEGAPTPEQTEAVPKSYPSPSAST